MNTLTFNHTGFQIDYKDSFLVSGEFHYFRVPKSDWERRMQLFKEAGGNCIATYVPWLIHEPDEGNIIFNDVPNRNLKLFLETAAKAGLNVILRPGPYQYSELLNDGLPTWLIENYPEILARNIEGKPFHRTSVSYLHPKFLEKSRIYYKAFADVVRPYLASYGGPVCMIQADNELSGIHIWFGSLDYNEQTMGFGKANGRFTRYLHDTYNTIENLNQNYGTRYEKFEQVYPSKVDKNDVYSCRRAHDYHNFYYESLSEYLLILIKWMREDGLNVPYCHNSAGPYMNSLFLESIKKLGKDFLLGSDHYYTLNQSWPQNNPTPQYALKIFTSLEMMKLMGMPPTVFEMPGGSPSDTPPILPNDLYACFCVNLAYGMKGVNYYIYTGGPNFPGTGQNSDIYDYNALVRADGSINQTYEIAKKFGLFLKDNAWMQRAERVSAVQVGFEWEYTRSNSYEYANQALSGTQAWDFLVHGVVYTLMCSKYAPQLTEINGILDISRPLIVPCATAMSKPAQKKLIDYVKHGGKLLLLGTLPETDLEFNSCTLLRDFCGNPQLTSPDYSGPSVQIEGYGNVYGLTQISTLKTIPKGAKVIAMDMYSNNAVGFTLTVGSGIINWIGVNWKMTTFDQVKMIEMLMKKSGAKDCVYSENRNIFTSLWKDDSNHKMLFLMNLYSGAQKTEIKVYDDKTEVILGEISLEPMEVKSIIL